MEGIFETKKLFLNQTWICLSDISKANVLTPGCGEGKYSIYCKVPSVGPSKENGQLMLRRPKLPNGFQGRVFKDSVRERVMGCMISSCTSF